MLMISFRRSVSSLVKCSVENNVKHVVLDNPRKLNSLSLAFLTELKKEITQAPLPAVILLKSSSRVFSAGHDLREFQTDAEMCHKDVLNLCTELCTAIRQIECPVLALVRGPAFAAGISVTTSTTLLLPKASYGQLSEIFYQRRRAAIAYAIVIQTIGLQLVAACDMVIATREASFALPGVKVGVFCTTPAVEVARCLPPKVVFDMLCTGEAISAESAYTHGLVSHLVENDEELEKVAAQMILKIRDHSSVVISAGKSAFYRQTESADIETAYKICQPIMEHHVEHKHAQSGINAFLEKKKPVFD